MLATVLSFLLSTLTSFLHVFSVLGVAYLLYYLWDYHKSLQRVTDLHKKCVYITGCDSGFGQALAKQLDSKGVPVFAGCLTQEGAEKLKKDCSSRLQTVPLNVTDADSIANAAQFVTSNLPDGTELWGLVNNAGILGDGGPFEFLLKREFQIAFDVNFFGLVEVTKSVLSPIKKSRGRIVNIASVLRFFPVPSMHPYTVSKWAVAAISETMRVEKAAWGIKVATLYPGGFRTNIFDGFKERTAAQWDRLPQHIKDEYGEEYHRKSAATPMGAKKKQKLSYSTDITPVIEAYEHALFATHPRRQYAVGRDGKIMKFLSTILPLSLMDRMAYTVVKGNLPLAVQKLRKGYK